MRMYKKTDKEDYQVNLQGCEPSSTFPYFRMKWLEEVKIDVVESGLTKDIIYKRKEFISRIHQDILMLSILPTSEITNVSPNE